MKTNNETKNLVIEPIMDDATMEAIVEDNISIVPKNKTTSVLFQRTNAKSLILCHYNIRWQRFSSIMTWQK